MGTGEVSNKGRHDRVANGQVLVPWGAWYGDGEVRLEFPESWQLHVANPARELKPLEDDEIRSSLAQVIGTKPIHELARGKKRVAVAIDDLTRPTPTNHLLPPLIEELRRGGINVDRVFVVIGSASHRFSIRIDHLKKLGEDLLGIVPVYDHHPYENLEYLGETSRGTPVYINKFYLESDLRIGVGTILPHASAGFGGGAKVVAIGLGGMETILCNHDAQGVSKHAGPVGNVDNPMRHDLEEIGRMAGLDMIVNVVLNRYRQICGVFVGDMIEAHRAGVDLARESWFTEAPRLVDIGVFNAYPKDTDAIQAFNAINPSFVDGHPVVRHQGAVVITTAASEGVGIHSCEGFGMRGYKEWLHWLQEAEVFRDRKLLLYSPNLTQLEVKHLYPKHCIVYNRWEQVIETLRGWFPGRPKVVVFPVGTFQLCR